MFRQSYTSKNIWWPINSSIHTLEISTLTGRYNSLGFNFKPHLCDFTSRPLAQGSPLICTFPVIRDDFEYPLKIIFTVKQLTRPCVCFVPLRLRAQGYFFCLQKSYAKLQKKFLAISCGTNYDLGSERQLERQREYACVGKNCLYLIWKLEKIDLVRKQT